MNFDGETYDPACDEKRLENQLGRVWNCMKNGDWITLEDLASKAFGSVPGVSARLRDLRKPRFGGYKIERRHKGNPSNGLYEYRMVVHEQNGQLVLI